MSEIDIYCKNGKCPICEKDITEKGIIVRKWICENGCYEIHEYEGQDTYDTYYAYVFGQATGRIDHNVHEYIRVEIEEGVKRAIRYFKKKDRYLAEILARK